MRGALQVSIAAPLAWGQSSQRMPGARCACPTVELRIKAYTLCMTGSVTRARTRLWRFAAMPHG
ncbi:hypothetical protein R69888_00718 [Paraburkholderia haematera]|uniref:Secreted protein n=1 Tax=Paraburkholderia haematera TaxID=2793077 RepID=A0ABN7KM87_9BURK|nr:hypothetical protein R69888_00718 [Paraburkholderia haematera]